MKIQHLAVIFCIIIIPVTMILSYYIGIQVNTINLQTLYDTKLMDATHDAIVAFQKNTINNNYSSDVNSQKRDVQASINTFFTSLSNNLGVSGYTKKYISPYVPAILFTMYDGYYIYSPTKIGNNPEAEYVLKPYIYYAERYKDENADVVINYSLDNYISVYGTVNNETISKAGYLVRCANTQSDSKIYGGVCIDGNKVFYQGEEIKEEKTLKEKYDKDGVLIDKEANDSNTDAIEYYKKAFNFSKWVGDNLNGLDIDNKKILNDEVTYNEFGKLFAGNPEDKSSNFEQHKREVMRYSILSNLQLAIQNYAGTSTYNFKIPIFTADDWEKIYTNISMVSLFQGLPVGTKIYNNYSIVTSTGNDKYVAPEELYFIDENTKTYHRINCPKLEEGVNDNHSIVGYKSIDFEVRHYENESGGETYYYYKHPGITACYECIVSSNVSDSHNERTGNFIIPNNNTLKKAYYSALARERNNLIKVTTFINDNNNNYKLENQ